MILKSPLTDHHQGSILQLRKTDLFSLPRLSCSIPSLLSLKSFCRSRTAGIACRSIVVDSQITATLSTRSSTSTCSGCSIIFFKRRPDVTTVASFASMKVSNPTYEHYLVALDVVKYLWQAKDIGLIIHPNLFLHRVRRPWSILLQIDEETTLSDVFYPCGSEGLLPLGS